MSRADRFKRRAEVKFHISASGFFSNLDTAFLEANYNYDQAQAGLN